MPWLVSDTWMTAFRSNVLDAHTKDLHFKHPGLSATYYGQSGEVLDQAKILFGPLIGLDSGLQRRWRVLERLAHRTCERFVPFRYNDNIN